MIYILGNAGGNQELAHEDYSFTSLYSSLNKMQSQSEEDKSAVIWLFLISRIYHLQLFLEKAEREGLLKEVSPVEYFLSQANDNSNNTPKIFEFFSHLYRDHLSRKEKIDLVDVASAILTKLHESYQVVRDIGISFAIDEAGAVEKLFKNQFYSQIQQKFIRGLLTGILRVLNELSGYYKRLFVCGTHYGLLNLEPLFSALGKETVILKYVPPSDPKGNLEMLKTFFDISDIDEKALQPYLNYRKRAIANSVLYLNYNDVSTKEQNLLIALDNSYKKFIVDLANRIRQEVMENKSVMNALKRVIIMNAFPHLDIDDGIPLLRDEQETVDLMNLGVTNQFISSETTDCSVSYIRDPMVVEIAQHLFNEHEVIEKEILNSFQRILQLLGAKSSVKGNIFELIVSNFMTQESFQGKFWFELPFIKEQYGEFEDSMKSRNISKCNLDWLKKIKYNCTKFGIHANLGYESDLDALIHSRALLIAEKEMHPDILKVDTLGNDGKKFFMIGGIKLSYITVSGRCHNKNFHSTDLELIYVNKYWTKKDVDLDVESELNDATELEGKDDDEEEEEEESEASLDEKRREFFKAFPPETISGIVRIVFEFPGQNAQKKLRGGLQVLREKKGLLKDIDQLIVTINMSNFHYLIPKDHSFYPYMKQFYENCQRYAKARKPINATGTKGIAENRSKKQRL